MAETGAGGPPPPPTEARTPVADRPVPQPPTADTPPVPATGAAESGVGSDDTGTLVVTGGETGQRGVEPDSTPAGADGSDDRGGSDGEGSPEDEGIPEDSPFVEVGGYLDDAFYVVHAESTAKSVGRAGGEASDVREILTVELDYGDGEKTGQNDQFLVDVITGEDGESSEILRGTLAALETITDGTDTEIDPQILEVAQRGKAGLAQYVVVEGVDGKGQSMTYEELTSRITQLTLEARSDPSKKDELQSLINQKEKGRYRVADEAKPPKDELPSSKSYKDRLQELEAREKAGKLRRSEQKELGRLQRRAEVDKRFASAETALEESQGRAETIRASLRDLETAQLAIQAELQALNDASNTDPQKATKIAERQAELARIPLRRATLQQEQLDVDKEVKKAQQEVQHYKAIQTLYTEQDRIAGQLKEIKDSDKRQEARRVLTALELATRAEGPYGLAIVNLALKNAQRVGHDTTVSGDTNDYLMRNAPSANEIAAWLVRNGGFDPKTAEEFTGALFSGDAKTFLSYIKSHPELLHKEKGAEISRQFFGQLSESDAYKAIRDILDPGDRAMMRKKLRKGSLTTLGLLAYLTYGLIIEPSAESAMEEATTGAAVGQRQ